MIAEFTRWWESVKTIFAPVVQWFKDKFKQAWDAIVAIFTGIGSWFSQRYNELKAILLLFLIGSKTNSAARGQV